MLVRSQPWKQHLGSDLPELIRNMVCSQDLLSKEFLFSLWTALESIFLASMAQYSSSHTFKERVNPNCGQDETLWLKPAVSRPYELWSKWDPLSSPGTQWAVTSSLPLRGTPEPVNSQVCYTWRTAKQQWDLSDASTPQGLSLHLSGNAKACEVNFSLTSKGNFSQVPCLYWLFVSVLHACAHML